MKKLIRIAAIISALVLVPVVPSWASAYTEDIKQVPVGSTLISIGETSQYHTDSMRFVTRNDSEGRRIQTFCPDGIAPGECDLRNNSSTFIGKQILPYCQSAGQEDCIEGLEFSKDDSTFTPAIFVRHIDGPTSKAIPEQGLTAGGTLSLWDAPGFPNGSGQTSYVVETTASVRWDRQQGKFVTLALDAAVVPYSLVTGRGFPTSRLMEIRTADGEILAGNGSGADTACVWVASGSCGVLEDFIGEPSIRLKVRLSNEVAGWFQGRLRDPKISVEKFSATNNEVVVQARPVVVPRFAVLATKENTPESLVKELTPQLGRSGNEWFLGQSTRGTDAIRPIAFRLLDLYKTAAKDTAVGSNTIWNFSSVLYSGSNRCFDDKSRVLGVVTTNATVYNGQVPEFAKGTLNYKVAGLHYASDGKTLNEGSYDLVMRSDVARCLYGFSRAPLSATVSVIGEGGENKVATTVVSEKDGWLKLAAYGFTFSSPTISVKLSQAKAPAKKTSITCVKGKLTKKVTAVGPKCPAGYKKK